MVIQKYLISYLFTFSEIFGVCAELSTYEFQPFYGAPFRGSKKDSFYKNGL